MLSVIRSKRRGFSLIELVIVVVIIGIIAAIAIPRMSRGATGANDAALSGNLAVLRKAIDLYQAEHDGNFPTTAGLAGVAPQLTTFSDATGATVATKDTAHPFGPYLRAVPPMTVGTNANGKGSVGIAAADAASIGWLYTAADGTIRPNCAAGDKDGKNVSYSLY